MWAHETSVVQWGHTLLRVELGKTGVVSCMAARALHRLMPALDGLCLGGSRRMHL